MRMKIAAQLGRTLHELEQTMSGEEFGMWVAYHTPPESKENES